jgi:hypothetical protein
MRLAVRLLALGFVGTLTLAATACSSGSTTVSGLDGGEATGETSRATGQTAGTGPTAPTGTTGATGLAGPVSLDIPVAQNITGAALYSCDGVEGTWHYDPGELPFEGIEFTIEAAPFEMTGGEGTLVIQGTIVITGAGEAGFVDTVDLTIQGTEGAPTMASKGVDVEATGLIEGVPIDVAQFFPENAEFPIVPGAAQC